MQKNLRVGDRLSVLLESCNTVDFIFTINGAGFNYHVPSSIIVTVTRPDGKVFYSGRLFDLYVFEQYYLGTQLGYTNVLRRLSTYKYNPSYFGSENYEYLRIQVPQGSQVDISVMKNTGRYDIGLHIDTLYADSICGDLCDYIVHQKEFPMGDAINMEFKSFQYMVIQPQYSGDLSVATYMQFASYFEVISDAYLGGISEDYIRRGEISYYGVNQFNAIQYSRFKGNYNHVMITQRVAGNYAMYGVPFVAFYIEK